MQFFQACDISHVIEIRESTWKFVASSVHTFQSEAANRQKFYGIFREQAIRPFRNLAIYDVRNT